MSSSDIIELKALGEAVLVRIRESSKAQNISLRLSSQGLELVLPLSVSRDKAYKFLLEKEKSIRERLKKNQNIPSRPHTVYKTIPLLGKSYKVKYVSCEEEAKVRAEKDSLIIYAPAVNANEVLIQYLQSVSVKEIKALLKALEKAHHVKHRGEVVVTDLLMSWGSISPKGDFYFDWRIILMPRHVFHYIVVNEFCHLKEMKHKQDLLSFIYEVCPDFLIAFSWLKKHGKNLYKYFPKVS